MKKFLKFVGYFLLVVLVLLLTLPIWIGWVVRPIANSKVSERTGANFNLGEFSLNPYTGGLHVGDMQLSNPTNGGYKVEEKCVELGRLDVDVDMGTVFSEKIVISSIEIEGLTIRSTAGGGNFSQIGENAAGPDEPSAAEEKAAEEKPDEEKSGEEAPESGKKVQIDKLVLKDLKLKIGAMPAIPVRTLTIEGIGADKEEGASFADAFLAVKDKVLAAAGAVGGKIADLGSAAADAVGEGAGKAVDAIGEGAGKAADTIGEGAGKAVDAIGEGAGKAVDAIGEGAGKAVDAVKGLFK